MQFHTIMTNKPINKRHVTNLNSSYIIIQNMKQKAVQAKVNENFSKRDKKLSYLKDSFICNKNSKKPQKATKLLNKYMTKTGKNDKSNPKTAFKIFAICCCKILNTILLVS